MNIGLCKKLQRNGDYLNAEYRNFVLKTELMVLFTSAVYGLYLKELKNQ